MASEKSEGPYIGLEVLYFLWILIEAWLSDRSHRVEIDVHVSGWETVTSGGPQGPVLGPTLTLFIIYINDIDSGITSSDPC